MASILSFQVHVKLFYRKVAPAMRFDALVNHHSDCPQLTLAHIGRKMKKKKLKQTNASAHLIQYKLKIREGRPEGIGKKGFVNEMSFKSGVKGRGSDRW